MITYNMRYRGPYEYDKFILNMMQFHNEINAMIGTLAEAKAGGLDYYKKQLDDLIDKLGNLQNILAYQQEKVHL